MTQASPLGNFRVLELGSTVAGPFCGRLLADFGAEVIKVEPPEGDPVRAMGKHVNGKSLYAASIFRNKKLIALDLRRSEAREIVKKLVGNCDILIENFRPGTMERWGLGYDVLREINPELVMVRISGFGQSGPYRDRPGYGFLGDAVSGLLHISGYPDRPPVRAAVPVTDMVTGIYGAFGAVMALLARAETGKGQCIDAALFESAFSLMEAHVPAFEKLGVIAPRAGSRLPGSTPNNLYTTADGGYIAMAASSDPVFRRLTKAMGRPELADDSRFATGLARVENEDDLDAIIEAWTQTFSLEELETMLHLADVPASKVFTLADVFRDPHFATRASVVHAQDDELGTVALTAPVPRLSETPGQIVHSGGKTGANTVEILQKYAGLDERELQHLLDDGIALDASRPTA